MISYVISHVKYALSYSGKNCTTEVRNETTTEFKNEFGNITTDSDCSGNKSDWPFYFIYLTSWSYTLIVLSFLFSTILVALRFIEEKKCLRPDIEKNCVVISPSYKGSHSNIAGIILLFSI